MDRPSRTSEEEEVESTISWCLLVSYEADRTHMSRNNIALAFLAGWNRLFTLQPGTQKPHEMTREGLEESLS